MKQIKLCETDIKNIKEYDWVKYFEYNNSHLLKIDFNNSTELSEDEIKLITPSIRAFQIGEGSEGRHLTKCVKKFADKTDYKEYTAIMKWFVLEENRHSQTLKKYMDIYHIEPAKKLWIDNVFRLLRKLMGLECEIIVLVTAEMIAMSYYTALSNAVNSKVLNIICQQMLKDELRHIVLQSSTLHKISVGRCNAINHLIKFMRKLIMQSTIFVVWHKYKALFLKGGYTYNTFKQHCTEYLKESIRIEETGNF